MTYMKLAVILNIAMDEVNDRIAESKTVLAGIDRFDIDKLMRLQMHLSPELAILRNRSYTPEVMTPIKIFKPYEETPRRFCNE